MAGLHFDITGDNSNFLRKLEETRNGIRSTSKQIEESGMSIEQMFGRMSKGAAALGAGFSAQQFVSQVMKVRGEFQQLEVAFNTMLGSEEKANTLMQQLVKTAATTPFDLQSVAGGAKQLLAYGTAAEDVNGTLIRLGDIAAGLSIPLGDLVYLYGTTMSQGRLYTQDLNQFTGRGIPMIGELAKQFGVAESEVKKLVESGRVGFPEVQKVIESLTNEGGKFGGLMEAQSKTITGQISNIEDAIDTMYNNIGKSSGGFINEALSGVFYLVENYEEVGKTIIELSVAYSTYKAVLMSIAAYQNYAAGVTYSAEINELSKLIPLKKQSSNEDIIAAVASGKLTQSKAEQIITLRAEVAAKLQSLQATEAQAAAEHESAMAAYKSATQRMLIAKQNMALAQSQIQIAIKSGTADEISAAKKNAQTASVELNNAAIAKNNTHKTLNIAATNKKATADAVSSFQTGVNTATQNANTASTSILTAAKMRLVAASKALGLSMLANPYVLVTAAIVGMGYGVYKLATYLTDTEKAQLKLNDAAKESEKAALSEQRELAKLKDELSTTAKGTDEYNMIRDKIVSNYGKYDKNLKDEIDRVGLLDTTYQNLTKSIQQSFDVRQYDKFKQEQGAALDEVLSDNLSKIQDRLYKDLGDEEGARVYTKIRLAIVEGEELDNEIKYTLGQLQGKGTIFADSRIDSYIRNIKDAQKVTDEFDKRARKKFGIDDGSGNEDGKDDGTKKELSSVSEEIKTVTTNITNLKKQIEDLRSGKTTVEVGKTVQQTIEDKTKELKAAEDALATLTGKDKSSLKEASDRLKTKQEQANILLEISRNAKDRENAERQTAFEIEQAKIDIMKDGFVKEQAQIELNHRKALLGIKQRGEEMVEAQQEAERKQWEKDGKKGVFTPKTMSVSQLSTEQLQQLAGLMNGVVAKTDHDSQELFDSMVKKYSTYTEQRKEIEKKFDDDIAAMQKKNTGGEYDANIKEADKLKTKALSDFDSSIIANKSMWSRLFSDTSAMSKRQIQSVIADIKKLTDYLEGVDATIPVGFTEEQLKSLRDDPEKVKAIYDELIKKQQELDDRTNYPLSGFTKGFNKLKESADLARKAMRATTEEEKRSLEYQAEAVKAKGMQYIADGAVEAADGVSFLADNLKELAKATGDEHLSETAEQFSAIAQNFAAAGKGFQSGGWIGAIIGGATDMLTQTFEAFTTAKAEAKEYEDNRRDFLNEYNLLMLRNRISSEEQDNVFGSAAMKRAAEAAKAAQDALAQYTDEVTKRTAPELKKEFNSLGAAIFSGGMFGGWLGLGKRASDDYKKQLKAYKDGYTDLQAMAVKTRDYSGWANFWGKKDKYTLLKDLRPELWDKETGEFDIEAAKAFLETNTQINDEQRKSIQNVIDLKETYEDALQVLKDDVSDTFGTLGNDIIDSVVGAVQNGDIAIDKFAESVGKTFENLGKKIAYELFFHKEFEKLQEDLLKTYDLSDSETIAKAQVDIVSRFFDTIGSKMDGAEEWLEKWKALAKEKGFDIFGSEETGKDWLGSTADSLTQSILDGLKAGKSGIKEFSDSFEDAMRTAVLNSIKMQYLEGPMKEFYKKFASLSESGGQLTATEIEELRNMYNDIVTGAMSQFDALKEISGLDFSDTSDNTLKGSFAKASQESITLIAGQFGHFGVVLEDIKNNMQPIREQMLAIREMNVEGWEDVKAIRDLSDKVEKNTSQIAENTQEIKTVADKISDNTKRTVEALEGRIDVNIKGM